MQEQGLAGHHLTQNVRRGQGHLGRGRALVAVVGVATQPVVEDARDVFVAEQPGGVVEAGRVGHPGEEQLTRRRSNTSLRSSTASRTACVVSPD